MIRLGLWLFLAARLAAAGETLTGLEFAPLAPREVRVFVPAGGVTRDMPVLVALDGQNLERWQLESAVAAAQRAGRAAPLVVAVASGADRIEEYGLAGTLDYAGRGRLAPAFQRFVVERLLPAVRSHYGVTAASARTGVMGASLGGLAAFDLAWGHPETFGFAGIFSGSFWWRADNATPAAQQASRLAHRLVRTTPAVPAVRFWFSAGTREEDGDRDGNGVIDAVQDTTDLVAELQRRGLAPAWTEVPGGRHDEAAWAQVLPDFLRWALPPAAQ